METLGFEDSDAKSLLLLNRVFRVGADDRGQYLDIEADLRHAKLIINESGMQRKHQVRDCTAREIARQGGVAW